MAKKSYASSQQAKQRKKSKRTTSSLEAEIKHLEQMTDDEIDCSDIPELDFERLGKFVIGKFYRPNNELKAQRKKDPAIKVRAVNKGKPHA